MGLDTTHNAWHGAYSSFHAWRKKLAEFYGIPLELMQGFYADDHMHPLSLVKMLITDESAKNQLNRHLQAFPLKWDAFKPNPLHELLYHSDCDGHISWKSCGKIAKELRALLSKITETDDATIVFKNRTAQFAQGCEDAFSKKQRLEFH